jgi:coenzyme F420-reducing hydrogenase gamma subunit
MKPKLAVHKFASCDGCQLSLLNAGEALLRLSQMVDIVHFAEAGPYAPDAPVDIAFVEGSISTEVDHARIQAIRANSDYVITIGACATAGGIQALRNFSKDRDWKAQLYASPEYVDSLADSTPIADHIKVDLELWGCPVTTHQVVSALRALLHGVTPISDADKVCLECKRRQGVCVLVSQGRPCMGPVTRTGCGAICPRYGRDCYACFGPAENSNGTALGERFLGLGLMPADVKRRFQFINNYSDAFKQAAAYWSDKASDEH